MAIIKVSNVSKKFCRSHKLALNYGMRDYAKSLLGLRNANSSILRPKEFWAVKNVSFEIEKGESIGLIGVNGSGKTTLLKMISGVLSPDMGQILVNGNIVPLFAKGAGFDPILSGYENIAINLSLLGLSQEEISEVTQDVVAFAELPPEAMEAPVRTYSSGMMARLGFACAMSTRPEVLIIDEALAVGDVKFRTKCYRKLTELRKNGTTIVLVSHSVNAIISNCEKAIFLKKGEVVSFGDSREVSKLYESDLNEEKANPLEPMSPEAAAAVDPDAEVFIQKIEVTGPQGSPSLKTGQPFEFTAHIQAKVPVPDARVCFIVKDLSGEFNSVLYMNSGEDGIYITPDTTKFAVRVENATCGLRPGRYALKVFVASGDGSYVHHIREGFKFQVTSDFILSQSLYFQDRHWKVDHQVDAQLMPSP